MTISATPARTSLEIFCNRRATGLRLSASMALAAPTMLVIVGDCDMKVEANRQNNSWSDFFSHLAPTFACQHPDRFRVKHSDRPSLSTPFVEVLWYQTNTRTRESFETIVMVPHAHAVPQNTYAQPHVASNTLLRPSRLDARLLGGLVAHELILCQQIRVFKVGKIGHHVCKSFVMHSKPLRQGLPHSLPRSCRDQPSSAAYAEWPIGPEG